MTRSLTMCVVLGLLPSIAVPELLPAGRPATVSGAIESEARRLAHNDDTGRPEKQRSWTAVRSLRPATEVLLVTHDVAEARRLFLSADGSTLNVLDLSTLPLRPDELHRIREAAATRPLHLVAGKAGRTVIVGPLEIRAGSVFLGSRQIASIDELVEAIPRENIVQIAIEEAPHASAGKAALIGAVAGGVVGAVLAAPSHPPAVYLFWTVAMFAAGGAGLGALSGALAEPTAPITRVIYQGT